MEALRSLWKQKGPDLLVELSSRGTASFSELLRVGGNPHTVTRRLGEFVRGGLATRSVEQDVKRTVTYRITPLGRKVARKVQELQEILLS